ncbi:MAG: homoprotocatechuate degradation operon regulator HpaR [Gammaproteobacteria bacterium]|jgi:homoprotocatechuate degradation regulator HpaR|nr:homoprotocatechuate degradation operon regulator HpaR [Gammaproteobacteria bacterium]
MKNGSEKALRSFDRSLPMALLRAREAVMKKFLPSLRANNLSSQQWRVIRALREKDGQDLSELSARCFLLMPSLSRIVQNLNKRGLISRSQSMTDNRRSLIYLTDVGHDLFKAIAPKSIDRYDYITDRFGYGKLELLYELLDDLVKKLDEGAESNDRPI